MNPLKEHKIVCKGISKFYQSGTTRIEALKNVDLTINSGEFRILMGPSGSGKTTLISIIAGILTQSEGTCLINNIEVNHLPDNQKTHFRASHIGFVFQAFNLIPSLTNEENICIPLLIKGFPRKEAIERSKEMLEKVGIKDKIGLLPTELSGGQQQRVAIARALVHHPEIIVCDEPTSFLDHITGGKIMGLLKETVEKEKITLIVVTHDPRIVPFADKVDYLEDGRITS